MPSDNSVTLVGNVTRDPELRFTNTGPADRLVWVGGQPALAEPPRPRSGEEAVSFFDVVCWREMAENVS